MTSESLQPQGTPARRTVVAAVGAAGLAVALSACGSDDKSSDSSSSTQNGSNATGGGSGGGDATGGGSGGGSAAAGGSGGAVLAKTADIPEGGGKVFAKEGVVVTQPTKGQFKAFSSKCTHVGCPVNKVANGVISCPCHHSEFSVTDGSVKKGPATKPLPAANISVSGDEIKLA
ncbi:Rieske (2Fe-2S) protein [Streptomyces sp. Li-HN-5-11]|uniref:Rieske (2Fe-2S) protein n=1 Tax=Streptomyces sp. Li-HN-5-11 TaxID=3075432 RepID=UPI0028ADC4AA|nr:Rieske (2Fe-2S) protein [Streptomyces sp. Li-HN-5-11]WNM33838.1 Rieske (2Fe-2S) protein [Streptomyces sp. Li-HN-5-11]